jgi:arginase family enzyme
LGAQIKFNEVHGFVYQWHSVINQTSLDDCQFMHSSYIFNEKYRDPVETLLDEFLERADLIMLSICLDVFDICADPAL